MTPKTQAVGDGAGNGTASANRPQPQAREAPLTNPTITQRAESIASVERWVKLPLNAVQVSEVIDASVFATIHPSGKAVTVVSTPKFNAALDILATLSPAPQTTGGEGEPALWALYNVDTKSYRVTAYHTQANAEQAARVRSDNYRKVEARPLYAALSASPPLEVVEALREAANEAVSMLAQAFGRIHSLPRTSDTELASRIVTAKEHLRSALSALQPDRFGLPGSASTADAATPKSAATKQVKP